MPQKKQRKKLLEDGCCAMCGKNKDNGKTLCGSCLAYKCNWNKQKRLERINNGLCTYCGKTTPRSNKKICEDCYDKHGSKWIAKNRKCNLNNLSTKKQRKLKIMDHYGGKCLCCGEAGLTFLTIDHIDENGAEHRRQMPGLHGDLFYRWLEKNNFPDGYQTLCYNCNIGKHRHNGVCPHQHVNNGV